MKTISLLLFASLSFLLFRCDGNSGIPAAKNDSTGTVADNQEATPGLNEGKKWKVDSSTFANVAELKNLSGKLDKQENKKLADYTAAADNFSYAFTQLVSSCHMTGPDHEALHQWLEPLETGILKMKKADKEEDAVSAFETIQKQLADFDTYFE